MQARILLALSLCAVLTLSACSWSKNANGTENPSAAGTIPRSAAAPVSEDGVTMKDGVMLTVNGGEMSRMDKDVIYEDGTSVKVDGTVTLADGTTLRLPEGMMITVDGELRMRNGFVSIQEPPVVSAPSSKP